MTEKPSGPGASTGTVNTPTDSSLGARARRSGRISKEIPILLFGSDIDGYIFTEETRAVVLSRHGAGIISRYRLMPEQELVLRWKEAAREAEVRVVGEVAQQGSYHTYGVAFMDDKLNFWQLEFPPGPAQQERPLVLFLECGACHETVELLNGDFEYDICAIHGGLTRFCKQCGMLTVWRQPQDAFPAAPRRPKQEEVRPLAWTEQKKESAYSAFPTTLELQKEPGIRPPGTLETAVHPDFGVSEQQPLRTAPEEAKVCEVHNSLLPLEVPGAERRARVRAKVNFFACLRSEPFGDEVVQCIDMARGGVSFRSRNPYEQGMIVQIAVPYSAEERKAPAIFVKARIANVRAMEAEGMYRYGVEFLR
jgi:hypothetical protein